MRSILAIALVLLLAFVAGFSFFLLRAREPRDPALSSVPETGTGSITRTSTGRASAEISAPARLADGAAREPIPSAPDPSVAELQSRIRALEAEVEKLSRELAAARAGTPLETADEIRAALRELDPNDLVTLEKQNQRRMELLELFLDRFADDPEAAAMLEELSGLRLADEPEESLRLLDRFATRVAMPAWRRDSLYGNVLDFNDRQEEAEQAYLRVIHGADTPETERWNARFYSAYLYLRRGQYDEARTRFEDLLALAGENPASELLDVIEGARNQLALIEQYTRPR